MRGKGGLVLKKSYLQNLEVEVSLPVLEIIKVKISEGRVACLTITFSGCVEVCNKHSE